MIRIHLRIEEETKENIEHVKSMLKNMSGCNIKQSAVIEMLLMLGYKAFIADHKTIEEH